MNEFENSGKKKIPGLIIIVVLAILCLLSLRHGSSTLTYLLIIAIVIVHSLFKMNGAPLPKKDSLAKNRKMVGYVSLALSLVWVFFVPSIFPLDTNGGISSILYAIVAGIFCLIGVGFIVSGEIVSWGDFLRRNPPTDE